MSNHGHRGVLSFRIQISPLCSECPVPCPPPKWTLVTCLVRLFTQQPLRSVSSSASSSSSSSSASSSPSPSSSSSFDLQFGFFDIHLPRTQRCDEREPGRMSAFALSDPPRPLWHNYLSCHPFSSIYLESRGCPCCFPVGDGLCYSLASRWGPYVCYHVFWFAGFTTCSKFPNIGVS